MTNVSYIVLSLFVSLSLPIHAADWGIEAIRAPEAWKAGKYGEGIRVLVVSSGIYKDHPALKDNYEKGRDFTGEAAPYPEFDYLGNGTHLAGVIVGVAPKVRLLTAKIVPHSEKIEQFSLAEAISWGIQEKVNVIAIAVCGQNSQSNADAEAALLQAEAKGILVTSSSDGYCGLSATPFPGSAWSVMAVRSVKKTLRVIDHTQMQKVDIAAPGEDVTSTMPKGLRVGSSTVLTLLGQTSDVPSQGLFGSADMTSPIEGELAYADLGQSDDFSNGDWVGKVVLVKRGKITFEEKVKNALLAGAVGVVIANTEDRLYNLYLFEKDTSRKAPIPVVLVSSSSGDELERDAKLGGRMSLRTYPTDYGTLSGVYLSSAVGYVAGVMALMKAAKPSVSPGRVRETIVKTAVPLADPQLGAGLIDAKRAVDDIAKP